MPNKLCFIIYSLGNGGAERVLTTLANYFINKYEITIITFNDEKSFYKLDERIKIVSLNSNKNSKNIFDAIKNNISTTIKLTKTIKAVNSDVVISFMTTSNILSILACKILNIPIIISERINYDFLQSKIWRAIRRVTYPFSDGMVVLSKYDYEKYSFVKDKKIIFNPIVFDDSLGISLERKEKIILAVGRLDKQKGFDMLLESISRVDMKDWKLLILGEGVERPNLEQQIDSLKLNDKVILKGRVEDVENYYNKASIFVLSSRYEGFPNVLAEAMSFGCSCVAFDCKTGPSDIIENGINGYLVKDFDIESMSKKIEKLIFDESQREIFFKKSLEIRNKLPIENIAKRWESYFEKFNNK